METRYRILFVSDNSTSLVELTNEFGDASERDGVLPFHVDNLDGALEVLKDLEERLLLTVLGVGSQRVYDAFKAYPFHDGKFLVYGSKSEHAEMWKDRDVRFLEPTANFEIEYARVLDALKEL